MDDAAELGRLIRESRLKKGMSLSQLAATVGRSSSSVRRWERGEVPPAKAIIGDLALALDLEESQLDELRPSSPIQDAAPSNDSRSSQAAFSDAEERKHTTLEQPVAVPDTGPPSATDSPVSAESTATPSAPSTGFFGDLAASYRSWTEDWSGWIRGGLTLVMLIVMLVVMVWAIGELVGALGEIWDSFDAEPNR